MTRPQLKNPKEVGSLSDPLQFLATQSSSGSLDVCWSIGPCMMFLKMLPLEYQKVIKTYLFTYLWDSSDSSDGCDISDSSDSSDSCDISDNSESSKSN